jgi:SAM-dependent methyltransferase
MDEKYTRMKRMTTANRKAWDGLAETHYRNYHIHRLLDGQPLLNNVIRREVGDVQGKSLVHLLCHIGTDTLSWALLGARVTGIDISPQSLQYARRLAEKMDLAEARFIEADILDAAEVVTEQFDIAFASTGVLCWLPDIQGFAHTARKLLHADGFFYILDGHPFRNMLIADDGASSPDRIQGSYFRKKVWRYDNLGDYTDPDLLVPTESYEWDWTLGEIMTAFCQAGFRIEFLHEFPQYFYNGYTPYDVANHKVELYPCTFSLKATAI